MKNRVRKKHGNITTLVVCVICFVILPAVLLVTQINLYMVDRARTQNVLEAASLLAANDLSRIVLNDPNFGFVSLSNYPPVGKATFAADGEPLPVTGINTLTGTVRQNTILAIELDNATMKCLADQDRENLGSAIKQLNACFEGTTRGDRRYLGKDIHGRRVELVEDVMSFLRQNLPSDVQLESRSYFERLAKFRRHHYDFSTVAATVCSASQR